MKAVILLATLKKEGFSHTALLSEFLEKHLNEQGVPCETIRLVQKNIPAGTYTRMAEDDDWPSILNTVLAADILIFATPVWWNNISSEMQRVIERMDELHDEILAGKGSRLEGKVGGVIVTGDSDGAQHVIAQIANFFNAVGVLLPPYATLSVLHPMLAKSNDPEKEEVWRMFEKDYSATADRMAKQLQQSVRREQDA